MKKVQSDGKTNPVVAFLSSVKLAVFLLITLALTSIIGTVIPQGETLQFYLERYGPGTFRLIKLFNLQDAYHSWWYLSLLALFTLNLVVCISRRLPFTMKLWKKDHLATGPDRLLKMPFRKSWEGASMEEARLLGLLKDSFGSFKSRQDQDGTLYLVERGKWSYWGLYGLHFSMLVIIAGALIGALYGHKGMIMLLEGDSTDHFMDRNTKKAVSLGYEVKCEKFVVNFYDTGAPKEFRSDLTILEGGQKAFSHILRVNQPMTYKGFTFYQASYQAAPQVTVRITSTDGLQKVFDLPAFQQVSWPQARLFLGVMQYLPNIHGMQAARIWLGGPAGQDQALWVVKGQDKDFEWAGKSYRLSFLSAQNRYMTGIQVKKDPGVLVVYAGFLGLLAGFVIVFWVPHRRTWLWIGKRDGQPMVVLAGQTNKNRLTFEKDFSRLADRMDAIMGGES